MSDLLIKPRDSDFLPSLYEKHDVAPADKTSNNISGYMQINYLECHIKEFGIHSKMRNIPFDIYIIHEKNPLEIHRRVVFSFDTYIKKDYENLPSFYWITKFYKILNKDFRAVNVFDQTSF